jgi:predicted phage tail component-like protein
LKFNNEKKSWINPLEGRVKSPFPTINRGMLSVPGRNGAIPTSTRLEPIIIYQPIGFIVKSDHDSLSLKDELASWLYTTDPAPLEFDDEPGRIYYAVVQNSIDDFERFVDQRRGTIQFLCYNPLGYGTEQSYNLSSLTTIANEGTTDTPPIFDLEVIEDSTRIEITNLTNQTPSGTPRSIVLGQPQDVDATPVDPKKLILHDTMRSTASWQGASDVDSGYVSGSFGVDGDGFYVEDWGETGDKPAGTVWIGPSLQKAIPQSLNGSFYADIKIANGNDREGNIAAVGIIEVYMRDANGQMVCKMQFGDSFHNAHENLATFVTGGVRYQMQAKNTGGWNNFDGLIRIMRDSNYYLPYVAMIDSKGNHTRVQEMYNIVPGPVGKNPVTSIQIAMRKPWGGKRMYQRIKEIKIYETIGAYEFPDNSVPLLFKTGDRLHIDVSKGLLLLNGEVRTDLFSLETDFFSLVEGLNRITLSENVRGTVTYRNRYL